MTSKTFKLSPLFVGLFAVWQPAQAEEFRQTCTTSTLCDFSILHSTIRKEGQAPIVTYHWIFSDREREIGDSSYQKLGQAIPENTLVATLKPQHYQNNPAQDIGNGIDKRLELIRLSNVNIVNENGITKFKPLGNATLVIPTGTTATLDKAYLNSELISISAANAIIEKGVTLTVNPSYAEANGIEIPDNYNSETGRAINISGEGNTTTSADIILNGQESEGIWASDDAKVKAQDHFIQLNGNLAGGITATNGAQIDVNNVSIQGNGKTQFGLSVQDSGSKIIFNNGRIALSQKDKATNASGYLVSTGLQMDGGKFEISNSHIEAPRSILTSVFGYDNISNSREQTGFHNVINITNSTLIGQDILLDSNLYSEMDETKTRQTLYSNTLNVKNSTLYGKIQNLVMEEDEYDHLYEGLSNKVALTMKDSQWTLNGNSRIDDILAVLNSKITFEKAKQGFTTLTLNDLIGSSTFTLNTDLANQQSDQIIINGLSEGSHKLDVKDSGNEPQAANGKVTLVKTSGNGEAEFSLLNRDYVDAGAYRYRLSKEQNDWVLSNKQAEPTKPAETVKPVEPTKPAETAKPVEPTKPAETVKPVEPTKPAETVKPVEPTKPAETVKPVEPTKPAETVKPVEPTKPAETIKPVEPTKPAETAKPVAPAKPAETAKPVAPAKPAETAKPVAPAKPAETAKPDAPVKPAETAQTTPSKLMLSGTSNALVGLRQAQLLQLEQGLVGIHQRLGEQKQVGDLSVWARNANSHDEFAATNTASNSHTSGFEQDSHQVQVGAETALSDNWRVGGFVENSRANIDFNGEYGSGKVKGQGVALILTYQGDDGFYIDNIAKYSRLKATSDYTNSQRYHGYSLSSEIGKAFEVGKFTLTPNAQLAWHSLSGKENEDRLSSLYARVGARLATHFDVASWKLQPYFEINAISSKNRSSQVRVNQYAFDVASSRGRVENTLGLNIAKGQHRFGIEAKTAYGKRLDQPFAVQAVYRYQW